MSYGKDKKTGNIIIEENNNKKDNTVVSEADMTEKLYLVHREFLLLL